MKHLYSLITLALIGCASKPPPEPFSPQPPPTISNKVEPAPPAPSVSSAPPEPPPDPFNPFVYPPKPLPSSNKTQTNNDSNSVDDFYKYFYNKTFEEYVEEQKKEAVRKLDELQKNIDEYKNNPKLRQKIYMECLAICRGIGGTHCEGTCSP